MQKLISSATNSNFTKTQINIQIKTVKTIKAIKAIKYKQINKRKTKTNSNEIYKNGMGENCGVNQILDVRLITRHPCCSLLFVWNCSSRGGGRWCFYDLPFGTQIPERSAALSYSN